jgi:hypothetical protein
MRAHVRAFPILYPALSGSIPARGRNWCGLAPAVPEVGHLRKIDNQSSVLLDATPGEFTKKSRRNASAARSIPNLLYNQNQPT